jgi:hypothetical protein
MTPEIILHRWVTEQSRIHPECRDYVGVLDIEKVESSSFRSLLRIVRDAMNGALRSETKNASGSTEHPPYHFDYIEVSVDIDSKRPKNAHAFQHEGFSFIAVTLPFVELLFDLSQRLSRSQLISELLEIDSITLNPDQLLLVLFQLQISFLVSHEYTHHVHRHVARDAGDDAWAEFAQDAMSGGMDRQAQELDADAYAIYHVLGNFVRGGGRRGALAQLGRQDLGTLEADALLLNCFFLSLMSLFCARWPSNMRIASARDFTHPPEPLRIDHAIRVAEMWCGQNQSVSQSWFGAKRFRALFRAAVDAIGGATPHQWDEHIRFLTSEDGSEYNASLFARFDLLRRGKEFSPEPAVAP